MILYHYTSAAGLYGIVASKSLWTSHYRFLNDTSEFRHGWDIVLAAIERGGAEIRQISSLAWEMIMLFREHSESVHAFVGSLTRNGDLLSQWRGYNRGQGFSIGFDADWLLQNASESERTRLDPQPFNYAAMGRSSRKSERFNRKRGSRRLTSNPSCESNGQMTQANSHLARARTD